MGVWRGLGGVGLHGSHTAMGRAPHVGRAFLRGIGTYREADRPGIRDACARLPFGWSFDTAARQVAGTGLDQDLKTELAKYLAAVPMTARQALHRWDDDGRVTTLLSQLPRTPEEMLRFVPLRPPPFQPGTKQIGRASCRERVGQYV